jgi:hypothetical protein
LPPREKEIIDWKKKKGKPKWKYWIKMKKKNSCTKLRKKKLTYDGAGHKEYALGRRW